MIWFTSDHHFFHKNIIKYANRPFKDIFEMNDVMIDRWNHVVKPDDIVYVLGDFAFASATKIEYILRRLKGNKILIIGNHDHTYKKTKWVKMGFDRATNEESIEVIGQRVELSHYPMYIACKWMLHGHVHNRWRIRENVYYTGGRLNVGVDVWDFFPVSLDKISRIIRGKIKLDNAGCQPYEGDTSEDIGGRSSFYSDVDNDFADPPAILVDQYGKSGMPAVRDRKNKTVEANAFTHSIGSIQKR